MSKKIAITILVLIALIIIGCISFHFIKTEQAINECVASANRICSEYNIENVNIKMKTNGDDVYSLVINGKLTNVDFSKIYDFATQIEKIRFNYGDSLIIPKITLNGDNYEIDILDEKNLKCNYLVVYTYRTQEDISRQENLKNRLPYKGMAEADISYTMLGEPDEKEYSIDYAKKVERARHIEYTWRDEYGNLQARATVMHWDFKNDKRVDGYIFDIYYFGEFSDRN